MTQLQTNYSPEMSALSDTKVASKSASASKTAYGRVIGEPKLSDEAKEYYEKLKKKFNNYDFILVSRDEKQNAMANAAKYANGSKTVVLIDEDKIERMATDASYRKKYEDILSGAMDSIKQLQSGLNQSGVVAQSLGIKVNDDGTVSYFAVLKKMSSDQKDRIEKRAHERAEEKKEDTVTFTADIIEELLSKIRDSQFEERSNNVLTDNEKLIGGSIDYRG